MEIRFLGHACFELSKGDTRVLVDRFLSQSPKAAAAPDELDPTHLFLTHGHFDHIGDAVDVAKRTGAQTVATAADLVGADTVIPCHYDTFPPIETDAEAFKSEVEPATSSSVVVLRPGESHSP